jgi:2-polyprenyl-6-methoxyphenol hydroxylase-like FAD-dependent oxidoreductase
MQGGCVALEDGIVLAQQLSKVWETADLQSALEAYERARARRCLPLTIRSRGMGVILQSALPPVVLLRDAVISRFLDPGHFFDHALFDVGPL